MHRGALHVSSTMPDVAMAFWPLRSHGLNQTNPIYMSSLVLQSKERLKKVANILRFGFVMAGTPWILDHWQEINSRENSSKIKSSEILASELLSPTVANLVL